MSAFSEATRDADIAAELYDGVTAYRHAVTVRIEDAVAIVSGAQDYRDVVALDLLVGIDAPPGRRRWSRRDLPGWRLMVDEADAARFGLTRAAPRYGAMIDRLGLARALLVCAGLAGGMLLLAHAAPGIVAPLVPAAWEERVGDTLLGDLAPLACVDEGGQDALAALARRIDPAAGRADAIDFSLSHPDVANAAALPGRKVVLFGGLLDENPEALAGVLAHEIAHVRRRHVTEAMIRNLGFGMVIGALSVTYGATASDLASLAYTRTAEEEADADAVAMLRAAKIDPRPTAALFRSIAEDEEDAAGGMGSLLRSHPGSRDRAERFARSHDPAISYRPVLGTRESDALARGCDTPAPDSAYFGRF